MARKDFTLLWASQAVSEFAYSTSLIALPLLVLTITGSPSQAGVIAFVDAVAMLLAGLPAGAVADRYDRRSVMLWCEGVLVAVFGVAALSLWVEVASLPVLVLLALVSGAATAVLLATGAAMVPALVPREELSGAVAMNSARTYAGQLVGTSAGGFLQAMRNALPFAFGGVAHAISFVLLLFIRPQPPAGRKGPRKWSSRDLVDGIRWISGRPFLRLGLLYATVTNFFYGAVYFVVIASAKTSGMSSGLVGVMAALLGVGGLLGALAAPRLQRVLTGSRPIFLVLWLFAVLTAGIALLPGSYTPGILLGVTAFTAPTASAYFTTYQLLLTPDTHRGRVMSVANICSSGGAAIAPLAGGAAFDLCGRPVTLLACSALLGVIALSAVLSPVMRRPPEAPAVEEVGEGTGTVSRSAR
ncbi:MFS transporter [Streptomyces sp. NBC_00047]|uniref:MFS transporter n=1 Tax=Streptomyces sp. NBC_00047 TaxID=2975627 RepID=UPI0022579F06|nr:MFS transporter [Streptomyces sp. NBC_00047]MCX5609332.1 MFS transporter [Streptomyces sp. NBC_00047]